MTAYELMIKTNHYLIEDGTLTDGQKAIIARQLMAVRSSSMQVQGFCTGIEYSSNGGSGRRMYPEFFIPPYNEGRKYRTIWGQMSKTRILSDNIYELEILRLLILFYPDDIQIKGMVKATLERLKTTCFGYKDDGVGECFDASLVVLRFLITAAPNEVEWIQSRIDNFNRHYDEKKRPRYCKWYYWLCLSELPFEFARSEINKYKTEMLDLVLNKSCAMRLERDKMIYPVVITMLRKMLSQYPEYAYVSLFGILPENADLDSARAERLSTI